MDLLLIISFILLFFSFLTIIGIFWLLYAFQKTQTFIHSCYPSIEIIITCHNEENILPQLLECVQKLEWFSENISISLVNDRSTDKTGAILSDFVKHKNHRRFKYLEIPNCSEISNINPKKFAITSAIQKTNADWVVTFDADSRPHSQWLIEMFYGFEKDWIAIVPSYRLIGGKGILFQLRNFEALIQSFLMSAAIKLNRPLSAIGAGFCYNREAFLKIGGFEHHYHKKSGDDDLLLHSLSHLPGKIISKCSPSTTIDIFDRDASSYWKARKRHYSVAKDYPLFWKLMGIMTIPGTMIIPFLLPLSVMPFSLIKVNHAVLLFIAYISLIEIGIQMVSSNTTHKHYIGYSLVFATLFPIWIILMTINIFRHSSDWK